MPARASRPCIVCKRASLPGLQTCALHPQPPKAWGPNAGQGRRGVSPALRARVLREEPICWICHDQQSTEVDHEVSRANGGTDGRSNLRGACERCHATRSGRQAREARGGVKSSETFTA